jgi:outer membrane receptor protein involved in Fe transport
MHGRTRSILHRRLIMRRMIFLVFIFVFPVFLSGAITGKIMGRVNDESTMDPLSFVNITLENTMLGAITNDRGEYFIINIPPGTYNVKVQMMGYKTIVKSGVRVDAGRTVFMNFEMEETVIEMKDVITVKATRPLILPGATHSYRIYETKEITTMPRAYSVLRLLETQPEIVKDFSLEEYHMRGGRGGEILYLVDGIPVNDRFVGGSAALDIPVFEVKQVEILKGGFETEYGEAQSGIVNLITAQPDTNFKVATLYKSDRMLDQSNTDIVNFTISSPVPFSHKKVLLQYTGYGNFTDTYAPFGYPHNKNEVMGIRFGDRQRNSYGFAAKALVKVMNTGRISLSARNNYSVYEKYKHEYLEIPDHTYRFNEESSLYSASWNHSIGHSSFYEVKFSSFYTHAHYDPGLSPPDVHLLEEEYQWAEDNEVSWIVDDRGELEDTDGDWFYEVGYDSVYHTHRETNNSVMVDYTKQFANKHLVKIGVENHFWKLEKEEIELLWFYDSTRIDEEGPYPGYGWSRDMYSVEPIQGGVYLQDKFEREGLTLNYGLRYDYFYTGEQVDSEKRFRGYFSPRIGFFYPFTDKIAFTFSFGLYYQMPEYQYIFMTTTWRGPYRLVGNPDLDPECTRAYEVKIENELPINAAISFGMYKKDIRGLINAEVVGLHPLESYKITNSSYGDARGFEFEFKKPMGVHFTGRAVYILSWAKGQNTKDLENFEDMELPEVMREYPLSWDERHRVKIITSYEIGSDTLSHVTGATAIFTYGSGLPYSLDEQVKQGNLAKNSERLPSHSVFDIEVYRKQKVGGISLEFSVIVENVFDQRNVVKPDNTPYFISLRDPTSKSKPRTILMELGVGF